jgi:hypothetical protein
MFVELVVVVSSTAAWAVAKRVVVDRVATVCTKVVGARVLVAPALVPPTIGSQAVPMGPPSCSITVSRLFR